MYFTTIEISEFIFTKFVTLDPDPHSEKLLDPDPQKMNADPQPCTVEYYDF